MSTCQIAMQNKHQNNKIGKEGGKSIFLVLDVAEECKTFPLKRVQVQEERACMMKKLSLDNIIKKDNNNYSITSLCHKFSRISLLLQCLCVMYWSWPLTFYSMLSDHSIFYGTKYRMWMLRLRHNPKLWLILHSRRLIFLNIWGNGSRNKEHTFTI